MVLSGTLWLFQAVAYGAKKDWGHTVMAVCYAFATYGLIYAWFRPVP